MAITREKIDQALASLGLDEPRRKSILGKRSASKRFMPSSRAMEELSRTLDKLTMATEGPMHRDGGQNTLSTLQDARNSTITGSTLLGPNGSGQFLAVYLSSANTARTVSIASSTCGAAGSSVQQFYGILQNKPGPGQAADVCYMGITKAVAGLGTIVAGTQLQTSSTAGGVLTPWLGGNGQRIGVALEAAATTGAVFTMALFGFGQGAGAT